MSTCCLFHEKIGNFEYSRFPNKRAGPIKGAGGRNAIKKIIVQVLIKVQGGILVQKNKRAGPNKTVHGGKLGKINEHTIVEIQSLINVQGGILVQKNKRAGPNKAVQGGKLEKINKRALHYY